MSDETDAIAEPATVLAASRPMIYVTRPSSRAPQEIGGTMADAFKHLAEFLARHGIRPSGHPLAVFTDRSGDGATMRIGLPVPPPALVHAGGEIGGGTTPSGRALKLVHRGPYAGLAAAHDALRAHARDHGLATAGPAWEVYVSDPARTAESDLVTEIYLLLG